MKILKGLGWWLRDCEPQHNSFSKWDAFSSVFTLKTCVSTSTPFRCVLPLNFPLSFSPLLGRSLIHSFTVCACLSVFFWITFYLLSFKYPAFRNCKKVFIVPSALHEIHQVFALLIHREPYQKRAKSVHMHENETDKIITRRQRRWVVNV